LLKAIRQSAPEHTLIVSPVKGNIDVIDMTPLADKNVVYSTHFYSPFGFTHQGAPWLKNLPLGQHYPSDKWNADYLKTDFFNPLMAWVNKHGVKVYMGEYGVLNTADNADKLAWLTDVGQIVTDLNLAAALWSYNPGFSILDNPKAPAGHRKFNPRFLRTLNL
jgi:endoglucanase